MCSNVCAYMRDQCYIRLMSVFRLLQLSNSQVAILFIFTKMMLRNSSIFLQRGCYIFVDKRITEQKKQQRCDIFVC